MNKAYIIQDIQAGDQNKGGVVDLLSYQITKQLKSSDQPPVIRHSGGPQCGHNVEANGKHHCFQMWGSGSFNGSDTYLLQNVLINPVNIERERRRLAETIGIGQNTSFWNKKMFIHEDCLVITPFHIALNRLQELKNKHGSVGSGCWAAIEFDQQYPNFSIRAKDLKGGSMKIGSKLLGQQRFIRELNSEALGVYLKSGNGDEFIDLLTIEDLDSIFGFINQTSKFYGDFASNYQILPDADIKSRLSEINKTTPLIFEGNQGTLLDPDFGFAPHTTANSSTAQYADEFCKSIGIFKDSYRIIGVTRPYMTRHGAGPFPSWAQNFSKDLFGERNKHSVWQGGFRVGRFDHDLLVKSLEYQRIDSLFVSCLDNDPYDTYFIPSKFPLGNEYFIFKNGKNTIGKAAEIAEMLNTDLCGFSFGPDRSDKYIRI